MKDRQKPFSASVTARQYPKKRKLTSIVLKDYMSSVGKTVVCFKLVCIVLHD